MEINIPGYRVVIVTLDSHAAGARGAGVRAPGRGIPGPERGPFMPSAEWAENPEALEEARLAVRHGDIIVANLLFIEEQHHRRSCPSCRPRRDRCDRP